jgi:transcriptional regulator with XRE-family HTH domain
MTEPRSFGAWLARERERRGLTIGAVADRTKIGASHLRALERGDVSRWPAGIYRHAFVKAYAEVVGLDADVVVANFDTAFPDPDAPLHAQPRASGELRLQFAASGAAAGAPPSAWRRAALDLGVVLAAALAGLAVAGAIGFWCAAAVAATACHLAAVLGGATWRPWGSATGAPSRRTAAADATTATPAA